MKTRRLPLVVLGFPALVAALACGGGTAPVNGDAGVAQAASTPDASDDADASAADVITISDVPGGIVKDDAQKIVVTVEGGFGPSAPVGSACKPADATYTFLPSSRDLNWEVCVRKDSGLYDYDNSDKTFSADDVALLTKALRAIAPSTRRTCGADKPVESIVITTASGATTYFDDFYACQGDGQDYVTGMDAVVDQLSKLSVAP